MTIQKKQKLLKHFNFLKSIGYKYLKPIDFHLFVSKDFLELPSNLDEIKTIVDTCNLCELSQYSNCRFFSSGYEKSRLMLIGEFPNYDSFDLFSGQSGSMLKNMCTNVLKIDTNDVYCTTILKCKVPANKIVHIDEVNACKKYLSKQIEIVNPLLIVTLGTEAFSYITNYDKSKFDQFRGRVMKIDNKNILSTFSTAFLLRNQSLKKEALVDMQKIRAILEKGFV